MKVARHNYKDTKPFSYFFFSVELFFILEHQLSQLEKQLISCNSKLAKYEKQLLEVNVKLEKTEEDARETDKKLQEITNENKVLAAENVSYIYMYIYILYISFLRGSKD